MLALLMSTTSFPRRYTFSIGLLFQRHIAFHRGVGHPLPICSVDASACAQSPVHGQEGLVLHEADLRGILADPNGAGGQ